MNTGYIFKFNGHGDFFPDGKVAPMTDAEIAAHNTALANAEWQAMLASGRGALYLTPADRETTAGKLGHYKVSDWPSVHSVTTYHERVSFHNMAGPRGRMDVWFMLDNSRWHGVNIGDNQICRVKRCKR